MASGGDSNRFRNHGLALSLTCLAWLSGCGYPTVSPAAYEYAKAIYSVANRRAADRLPELETRITDAAAAGEINETEAGWLLAIVEDARPRKMGRSGEGESPDHGRPGAETLTRRRGFRRLNLPGIMTCKGD